MRTIKVKPCSISLGKIKRKAAGITLKIAPLPDNHSWQWIPTYTTTATTPYTLTAPFTITNLYTSSIDTYSTGNSGSYIYAY